jgi:hypothetical protein
MIIATDYLYDRSSASFPSSRWFSTWCPRFRNLSNHSMSDSESIHVNNPDDHQSVEEHCIATDSPSASLDPAYVASPQKEQRSHSSLLRDISECIEYCQNPVKLSSSVLQPRLVQSISWASMTVICRTRRRLSHSRNVSPSSPLLLLLLRQAFPQRP